MRIIFLLVFVIIRVAFCGYTTKAINESKGYSGGFLMGVLLVELGILIAVFKKELPDAPPNSYRVVPVVNVLKKYHYPFVSPQVEPIDILKGNIYAEAEAGKVNIVFYIIHSLFLMLWYCTILGAYLWYVMGYTVYWLFKYKLCKKGTAEDSVNTAGNAQSIKDSVIGGIGSLKERAGSTASKLSQKTEGVKTDAVEKAAFAKEKAGAALAGLKGKAATLVADRKKAVGGDTLDDDVIADENFPVEEAYSESDAVTATADYNEEESDAESFDELYKKAMDSFDDEESYDEAASLETDTEDSYNEETVNEVKEPVDTPSVDPTPARPTSAQPKPAPRQFSYESDTPDDEGFADENFPVEEAYSESDAVTATADYNEEVSDAESFDELYKKAMDSFDDEESYDEAASLGTDTEDGYNEKVVNEVREPVDTSSVDPTPAPPTSAQPKPAPRQFSYEEEKKSPVIFVLVGVIAVQLVGVGILGGMLLMKNKDNNGSDNSSNDEIITTTTEEKSNEANTASAQAVTSEITAQSQEIITASEATTEASKGEKVDTSDAVKRALIAHLDKEFANEKSQEYYYFDRDVKYAVYDVNADGIDELFISYDTTASHNTDVYIYKNNNYVLTEQVWEGGISVCLEEQFLFVQQYGGATVTRILNIYDGNLVQTDELILSASSYTHNGISITQNEYDKLLSNYQSKEMIELWNNTKPVSELIDISSYQKSNTQQKYTVYDTSAAETQPAAISPSDPYAAIKQEIIESVDNEHYSGKNSHIENAPADMRFYNMSERYNMNVSSPTVYEGPGTNYSKIEVYSDFFWVYGENSDWYYVEWGEGNGAFSHCCYGYMSKSSNNNSAAKYTEYDTSAAGSDFSFNNEPYSRKVRTESGNLNLRAAPSTSAEIIIEMPKDSSVSLWGVNSEWAYVSYTVNGTTYYGYASNQYIGVP